MTRYLYLIVLGLLALALASCGGGGDPAPATGTVSGDIDVVGPFNGAVELNVGLFASGSDVPAQTTVAGRVGSAASANINGFQIDFSFTEVALGTYTVRVFSPAVGGVNNYYYTSDEFTTSSANPSKSFTDEQCSFAGEGPWGTISGVVQLQGNTTFPSSPTILTFIGFAPAATPQAALQWLVSPDEVKTGQQLFFNVDGLTYGTWVVGLFTYDVAHPGNPNMIGLFDDPVTISASDPNATGVVFPADFDGDPGIDPDLGVISGTITFNADLPAGQFISVGANTIPPQQGAPISSFDVAPGDLDENRQVSFTLPELPDGDYSVAIFVYDFATHTAVYFGEYPTAVTIADGSRNIGDIDFDADVSIISGS